LFNLNFSKFKNPIPILQFEKEILHKEYFYHLYELFKNYYNFEPKKKNTKL
jgi:hypothetical protein